jgi:tRNA(fMet)-specific endonuclease VapC
VEERLSVDTTFLIDLQRERARGSDGPAHTFLRNAPEVHLCLSVVAFGEFAEGFDDPDDPTVHTVRAGHLLLPVDAETSMIYADRVRKLRRSGTIIGGNDLWIGCTSIRHQLALITANADDFRRIDGLRIVEYR